MKIDWFEQLQGTLDTERCVPVPVRAEGQSIEGYVQACRLPPAQAAEARRRVRAKAKKKGRCVQRRTLLLAEWVLIFTTRPPALLPTATLAALYRLRWQVEIYQPYNLHKCLFSIMRQWWQATACARQWLALRGAVSAQP
ncbi:MAG: hypothetical protein ACFCVA_04365, partial [Gammaproteobacteria bacterium]